MKKLIQMTSLMVAAAGLVLASVASAHGKYEMHPKQERMHRVFGAVTGKKSGQITPHGFFTT